MAGHYGVGPNSSLVKWLIQESHPLSAKKACVREQVVFVNDPLEKTNAVLFQKWIGQQLHTCVWNKAPRRTHSSIYSGPANTPLYVPLLS